MSIYSRSLVKSLCAVSLIAVGCSSDTTEPGGQAGAGAGAAGGSAGTAGTAGTGGSAGSSAGTGGTAGAAAGSGGTAGTAGSGGSGGANTCTVLPANLLLTDFSAATFKGVTDGMSWTAAKADLWGSATSLTGGDGFYQGNAASAATATLNTETLTLTATVQAGDYMGYMFNFGPKCSNAGTTQGLKFDILEGSTLGGAALKVQMQQKSDFPSTASPSSRPGDCVPMSMDTQWSDCLSPGTSVVTAGQGPTVGATSLLWTAFSGGAPVATVDNTQLMAIQWQFECPASSGAGGAGGGGAGGGGNGGGGAGGGGAGGGGNGGGGAGGGCTVAALVAVALVEPAARAPAARSPSSSTTSRSTDVNAGGRGPSDANQRLGPRFPSRTTIRILARRS